MFLGKHRILFQKTSACFSLKGADVFGVQMWVVVRVCFITTYKTLLWLRFPPYPFRSASLPVLPVRPSGGEGKNRGLAALVYLC